MEVQIDKKLLDKIMNNLELTEGGKHSHWNVWDIVNHVYDSVYMYFKLAMVEEKNLREKYEKKVIEKVTEIDKLQEEITALRIRCGEEGEEGVDEDGSVPLQERSSRLERLSRPYGV